MKKLLFASTILAAATALPLSGAIAAGEKEPKANQPTQTQMQNERGGAATGTAPGTTQSTTKRDWNTSREFTEKDYDDLAGKAVHNMAGKEVGEIDEIVQSADGDKRFAVIGVGGFLGIGEKKVAVPMEDLRRDAQDDNVILLSQMSEGKLETMPEYEKSGYKPWQGPGTGTGAGNPKKNPQ